MPVSDRPEHEPVPARDVLWRFAPMIYGPTVLFALGEGAVIPLIPVIAAQLGADVATAALVASALVVGQLCGNIPAGWAVARIGERLTMAIAGAALARRRGRPRASPRRSGCSRSVFLIGFCAAAFGLARHSFMTTRVPLAFRARALSLLGGTFRLGMFIGPFVAAGLLVRLRRRARGDLVLRGVPRRHRAARAPRPRPREASSTPTDGATRP